MRGAAQKEIQDDLKPRPEYVVDTSEFEAVKDRLAMLENRHKVNDKDLNKPRLRRAPHNGTADGANSGDDQDSRPTLKRRD